MPVLMSLAAVGFGRRLKAGRSCSTVVAVPKQLVLKHATSTLKMHSLPGAGADQLPGRGARRVSLQLQGTLGLDLSCLPFSV